MKKIAKSTQLFGLTLVSSDKSQVLRSLEEKLSGRSGLVTVATPNPEQVIQSIQTASFAQTLETFDLLLPDGTGLVVASRLLQNDSAPGLQERIAGVDVAQALLSYAQKQQLTVLILGGRGYAAAQNVPVNLQPEYPELELPTCFWLEGFADVTAQTPEEIKAIKNALQEIKPVLVFVAFGAPHQEMWVQSNREMLEQSGVRVAMVVGGAFDYVLGKVPRAPLFLQHSGLEWAYRLVQQPWRWRRQLRLIQFGWLVLVKRLGF